MQWAQKRAMTLRPNLGALVELWHVFPVLLVVALTVQDRQLLETRPGAEECSTRPRSGAAGTAVWTWPRSAMPLQWLWLPAACRHWWWHVATESTQVAELPLVVTDGIESLTKTKQAVEALKKLGCGEELQKVIDSKALRAGKGKARSRRYVQRLGPLVIYNEDNGITRAMRNIPGVETAHIDRLNLLRLAPGGAFGRFVIFTESAFKKLSEIYGTLKSGAPLKKGYHLPRAAMDNADLARIINSTEVQSVLRPKMERSTHAMKRNALKNKEFMEELNPGSTERKASLQKASEKGTAEFEEVQKNKKARIEESKKYNKENKKGDDTFYKTLMKAFEAKAAADAAKKAAEKAEEEGEDEEWADCLRGDMTWGGL